MLAGVREGLPSKLSPLISEERMSVSSTGGEMVFQNDGSLCERTVATKIFYENGRLLCVE